MYAENLISTPEAQADFYPTPKELGKKMLSESGLNIVPADNLTDAAKKIVAAIKG